MQQRLVKYLTEDKVFGAQILCSAYFLVCAVRYWEPQGGVLIIMHGHSRGR